MALVTLTDLYSNLGPWPGNLFSASDGVTIGAHTATSFSYTYAAGTKFAGFSVTSTGVGFAYDGSTPIGGSMRGLTITDATGHLVLNVSGIAAGSLASDLALFVSYEFGWTDPGGGGTGAQVKNAWSQLLSSNDTYTGTSGNDRQGMVGVDAGNDTFNMGAGDDRVNGGLGNDTINGGDGYDTLDYGQTHWNEGIPMVRGITVDVATGTVLDPYGFTDHFTGIEQIQGSSASDLFTGAGAGMMFEGLRGSDTIIAGTGDDWAIYQDDTWFGGSRGIIVNLQNALSGTDILGTIRDGFGNLDHTVNLRSVGGTRYDDTFTGSSVGNSFAGGEGKDSYNGGGGFDWVDFDWNFTGATQHGIIVNLKLLTGKIVDDGYGNTENAVSIENIWGSHQDDRITGSLGTNTITGNDGNDTMTGGGGHDVFQWERTFELGDLDIITDFRGAAGVEQDVLRFHISSWGQSTTLHLVNGTTATTAEDTFLFNSADHSLSWDADGTGAQAAIHIATLNNVLALNAANFDLF